MFPSRGRYVASMFRAVLGVVDQAQLKMLFGAIAKSKMRYKVVSKCLTPR